MHNQKRRQLSWLVSGLFAAGLATGVHAAEGEVLEEVVVTGSYIKGTPEDAELPVDVLNRDDLEAIGDPSIIEMVRNLGVSAGNLGETNQFQAGGQANEGMATINLRGLGAARTLVLINGRRHVATENFGVDINAIPVAAIGRLEILKDGAAALYGSDAIGGVVNFITREGFEGLEIGGSFQDIPDGDGDFDTSIIWGMAGDKFNWMIAAEYGERSEIPFRDKDWAALPYSQNSQGGWSGIANPGNILYLDGSGVRPDPNCELLGAWRDSISSCGFQFTQFDNLVEETEMTKVFTEFNYDLSNDAKFHIEALYALVDIPSWKTSPSYPPQSLFGSDRIALANHPGLVDMRLQNPTMPQSGHVFPITRAMGVAGRSPNGTPEDGIRETKTYRVSTGLEGSLFNGEVDYNISASWSKRERHITGTDMYIERMGFAMRGLGGASCDRGATITAGTYGQGNCEYYNPFSNAIQRSVVNGVTNPQYNPDVANSASLLDWLIADTGSQADNELLVFEAIFSGMTPIELSGGTVGYAFGAQTRRERYDFTTVDVANRALNPCPWTDPLAVSLGFTSSLECTTQTGLLAFLAAGDAEHTSRRIYGYFAELALPVLDNLNVQAAIRYEDYGGNVGSTIDPKLAFSWQLTDEVSVRGSASTTFRGPPQSSLSGVGTALQFIAAANAFKAVDIQGNPTLEPEKAFTSNLGIIYRDDAWYASLDWWRFDFEDSFQTESAQQIITAYATEACFDGGAGVGTATCDALRTHVAPTGVATVGVERTITNIINGEDISTSGFDFLVQYDFADVAGGMLTVGTQGTYVLEYESDDFLDINGVQLAKGGDFVGKLNDGDPFTPKPELKGNIFVTFARDIHRVSLISRYVDSYEDVRPGDAFLATVDDHWTFDLHYNLSLFDETTKVSFSVINVSDEDPPQAATDLNYDPFTHNPFGRMIKLGIKYTAF